MLIEDVEPSTQGFHAALVKQKRPQPRLPHQDHRFGDDPSDPVRFVVELRRAQLQRGFLPTSLMFARQPADRKAFTLDAAVKLAVTTLKLPSPTANPFTGHCVRVGAVSEAFALGVPLLTCSYMCGHKSTASTSTYVRHGTVPSDAAAQYYLHLKPDDGGNGRLTL
jgi:hypothetical protein